LGVILVLSGCATPPLGYDVRIDSISRGDVGKKRYVLFPGKKGVTEDDLQFQEFSAYTHRALQWQGFVRAESFADAEVAIFLYYDVSDPHEYHYSYSVPIFGQTGVSSAQTYGNLYSYGNWGTCSGYTTYTPTYGIVGSTQHSGSYVLFTSFISFTGYDVGAFRETNKEVQLWKTDIFRTESSGDLRMVFPVMMAGAASYIGRNTGGELDETIFASDPRIQRIRGVSSEQERAR
jgi:hypothetical protein